MKTIDVLILGQDEQLSEQVNLKELIKKRTEYRLINTTNNLDLGFTLAERHQPILILLNIDLAGNDGLILAEVFCNEFPGSTLILVTRSDSKKVLRHALSIGAQGVLTLPIFEEDKAHEIIFKTVQRDAKRREVFTKKDRDNPEFKTIVVAGLKGGVGKTTIATNLAFALRKATDKRVALIDLDLVGGHVSLISGITWNRTIKDLVDEISDLDEELIETYCASHPSGVKIIQAPFNPEAVSFIQAENIEKILQVVGNSYNYVVIDTPPQFSDLMYPAFIKAKEILLVSTMDIASLTSTKKSLEILESLNLGKKAKIIINKAGYNGGIKIKDLEETMGFEPYCIIPNIDKLAIDSVNNGEPFVITSPSSKAAREITVLAKKIIEKDKISKVLKATKKNKRGLFSLFKSQGNLSS